MFNSNSNILEFNKATCYRSKSTDILLLFYNLFQDDQDSVTFQPMEQMKGSKIKYTGTGYIQELPEN